MKLRFLVPCLAFALMNLAALAQDNPTPVNPSTASSTGVGPGDVGLYVNPIGIGIRNSMADFGTFAFLGDGDDQAHVLRRRNRRLRQFLSRSEVRRRHRHPGHGCERQ